jgi:divalent metal cation (Fe/Co/Zn/Cd) transporter
VERSEKEIVQVIKKRIEAMKDVKSCHQVSVRMGGKRFDVNMHVSLASNLKFEDVHKITSSIEREIMVVLPNARVTVQTEPLGPDRQKIGDLVKKIAESVPASRGVHDIHVQKINGKICVDLHVEVSANMTVRQAHEVSDQIERKLRASKLNISDMTIHMDTAADRISRELEGDGTELEWYIEHLTKRFEEIKTIHGIKIRRIGGRIHVVFQCHFNANISMGQAHGISSKLESLIKNAFPDVDRVDIHQEPA